MRICEDQKHTDPDPEHCLLLNKPENYYCDAFVENSMLIEGSAPNIEESFRSLDPDKIKGGFVGLSAILIVTPMFTTVTLWLFMSVTFTFIRCIFGEYQYRTLYIALRQLSLQDCRFDST